MGALFQLQWLRPITSESTKLNIVYVRAFPVSEHEYKFVLRAVERAHAAVGFDPDGQGLGATEVQVLLTPL